MKTLRLFALAASLLIVACAPYANSSSSSNNSSSVSSESSSQLRQFTLTELAQYNGDNGSLAYIAVSGTVYDVTNAAEWENGWHKGMHLAGTDCTAAFADSPHSQEILSSLPIVGTLV